MGTLIVISSIAAILLGIFYVIGFWSTKIAGQVEIILLAIANLEPKHQRTLRIPDKIARPIKKFILDLIHRRRMHAVRKEAKKNFKKWRRESHQKTAPK